MNLLLQIKEIVINNVVQIGSIITIGSIFAMNIKKININFNVFSRKKLDYNELESEKLDYNEFTRLKRNLDNAINELESENDYNNLFHALDEFKTFINLYHKLIPTDELIDNYKDIIKCLEKWQKVRGKKSSELVLYKKKLKKLLTKK
ncbi:hypothetical protein [Candidatus Deianiraea vastatrix]|uniref:Uncharacterized protein n=1 Tax=Candidatus Deianiraea vastatrix TaxID=2163644 RepID=A0A5B8XHR8_9RICK|nr:hypothetical protein [Candidatus Deianiraea vastatrix]QED23327.1 hypothetical protein Deia_00532 [Candidatus Deianiraea vastatrix]